MSRAAAIVAVKNLRIVLPVRWGEMSVAEASRREKVSGQTVWNWLIQALRRERQLEVDVVELTQVLGEAAV